MVEVGGYRRWFCFEVWDLPGEDSGRALPAAVGTICDPPPTLSQQRSRGLV